jgi:hypothetical protein
MLMTEPRANDVAGKAVQDLQKSTAKALKSARGDDSALRAAVAAFIKRGKAADIGNEGMNGFLAVGDSNAIDLAGYTEEDAFRVMEIFDELMEEYYRQHPEEAGGPGGLPGLGGGPAIK